MHLFSKSPIRDLEKAGTGWAGNRETIGKSGMGLGWEKRGRGSITRTVN